MLLNDNRTDAAVLFPGGQAAPRPQSIVTVIAALLVVAFSAPAFFFLHPIWLTPTYSHGYLVLALTVLLVFLEVRRAPLAPLGTSWTGVACVAALMLVVIAGLASTTMLVAQAAVPLLWMAAAWALMGATNARRFVLPFGYLYFAIPAWDLAVGFLQRLTVQVVSFWIRAVDIPAYIDSNFIHLPSGTFEVQGGCAGLRYVIVALTLAAFLGLTGHQRCRARVSLCVFAVALALVANWVRVFTIVAVGHVYEMRHFLIAREHDDFGMTLFAVCMVLLFFFHRRLQSRAPAPDRSEALAAAAAGPATARPGMIVASATCAIVGVGLALNYLIHRGSEPGVDALSLRPPEIEGWDLVAEWQDARTPLFFGPTAQAAGWYVGHGSRVGAYLAHYATQRPNSEVVLSQNDPQGSDGDVVARNRVAVETASGKLPFQELEIIDAHRQPRLAWVGLRVAGEPAADDFAAKVLQVAGAIRGRRDAQALVLMGTCRSDCGDAREALNRYAHAAAEAWYEQAYSLDGPERAR